MKHAKLFRPRTGSIIECANCGKGIYKRPSEIRTHNYCSPNCHNLAQRKGEPLICKVCGKEYYRSPGQIRWRGSSCCSNKCKGKALSISQVGSNNHQWKNGVSTESHCLRASKRWRVWREAVFSRDNWTCQDCGGRSSNGNRILLHPHHIKSFADYPELRFEVSNGITFCEDCHKRHTTWQTLSRRRNGTKSKN